MPKLPSADEISRSVPVNRGSIARYQPGRVEEARRRGAALEGDAAASVSRANQQLGQVISDTSDYLMQQTLQFQERRDRQAYAQAKSEFLKQKVLFEGSLDDDENFETYGERYNEQINKVRDQVAEKIKDNYLRDDFVSETNLTIAQGMVKVTERARSRERDHGRAIMEQTLTDNIDSVARAQDEFTRTSLIRATNEQIQTALDNDYISAEEAQAARETFSAEYARNRLLSMPEPGRITVLNEAQEKGGTWVNYLPANERLKMLNAAQDDLMKKEAQFLADQYVASNLSLEEGFEEAANIENAELREQVEARFQKTYILNKQIESDNRDALFNEHYLPVRNGELTIDQISREVMETLSPQMVESLHSAEERAIAGRELQYSDQSVIDRLYVMEQRGDWRAAREYLRENAHKLTGKDYDRWSEATAAAEAPRNIKSQLTTLQILTNKAKSAKIPDSKIPKLTVAYDNWQMDYQAIHGKEPTDKERDDAIDRLLLNPGGDDFIPFNELGYVFESAPASVTVETIRQTDPSGLERIRTIFTEEVERDPTASELVEYYKAGMGY